MAKKKPNFILNDEINKLEIPLMLRKGFEYYITVNEIKISNNKELHMELDKFKNWSVTN